MYYSSGVSRHAGAHDQGAGELPLFFYLNNNLLELLDATQDVYSALQER